MTYRFDSWYYDASYYVFKTFARFGVCGGEIEQRQICPEELFLQKEGNMVFPNRMPNQMILTSFNILWKILEKLSGQYNCQTCSPLKMHETWCDNAHDLLISLPTTFATYSQTL